MSRLVFLVFMLSCSAHATEAHWCNLPQPHPIDARYARAMEQSGGVTVVMHDAVAEAYDGWDAALNRLYRDVMRDFGKDARATALREAQRAWLAWDKAETRSDLVQQGDGGSAGPLTVTGLAMQRRRDRACALHGMREGDAAPD